MGSRPEFGVRAQVVASPVFRTPMPPVEPETLRGKVVLITAGACSLGAAIARTLGQAGARLVLTDAQLQRARDPAALLAAQGIDALAMQLDVADALDCTRVVRRVHAQFGRLDALINNTAIDLSAARSAALLMAGQPDGGHIVNVAAAGLRVFAVAAGGLQTRIVVDRFAGMDTLRLQDPQQVARAVRLVLQQPCLA